jgi:hypothetical protein
MCHIFQAARWYSALETKAAPPTFSSEKRGIPAKQEAPLISDLAAAMSSSDGANETSEQPADSQQRQIAARTGRRQPGRLPRTRKSGLTYLRINRHWGNQSALGI